MTTCLKQGSIPRSKTLKTQGLNGFFAVSPFLIVFSKSERDFTDPYILPLLPAIKLKNPTQVLEEAMEKVRRERTFYRAKFIPLDELYTKEEIQDLIKEFSTGSNEKEFITLINLNAVLMNMNFELSGKFKVWGK